MPRWIGVGQRCAQLVKLPQDRDFRGSPSEWQNHFFDRIECDPPLGEIRDVADTPGLSGSAKYVVFQA
jgi:hypothetical protein